MLPPIRCFTCNKILAPYYECHSSKLPPSITRYCCKRMLLSSVDLVDIMNTYESKNICIDEVDTSFSVLAVESHRLPTK